MIVKDGVLELTVTVLTVDLYWKVSVIVIG